MNDQLEWGFDEPPDQVDLDRVWREMMSIPAAFAYTYLGALKARAPKTYARLRAKRLAAGCRVFDWGNDDTDA